MKVDAFCSVFMKADYPYKTFEHWIMKVAA